MTVGDAIQVLGLLVMGAAAWQAIGAFFFRPRLYKAYRSQNLVTLADPARRARIEGVLRQQGEPTALIEIEWWNAGRKASGTATAVVTVPGNVVGEVEVVENSEAKTLAPVQIVNQGNATVQATKAGLNPSAHCRIVVGYVPDERDKADQVTVLIHAGGRAVPNARPPGTVSPWILFPLLVICLIIPPYVADTVLDVGERWFTPVLGGLWAGMFMVVGIVGSRLATPRVGPSWGLTPRNK